MILYIARESLRCLIQTVNCSVKYAMVTQVQAFLTGILTSIGIIPGIT